MSDTNAAVEALTADPLAPPSPQADEVPAKRRRKAKLQEVRPATSEAAEPTKLNTYDVSLHKHRFQEGHVLKEVYRVQAADKDEAIDRFNAHFGITNSEHRHVVKKVTDA